jgi:molybdopterin converting factor small subunit
MGTKHELESATQVATAQLTVLAEGQYTVKLSEDSPSTIGDLLAELGITQRGSQWYMDGVRAQGSTVVRPGSEIVVMPEVHGG